MDAGTLTADGTTGPIIFTSAGATTAGAWNGVDFRGINGAVGGTLRFTIQFAGGGNSDGLAGLAGYARLRFIARRRTEDDDSEL